MLAWLLLLRLTLLLLPPTLHPPRLVQLLLRLVLLATLPRLLLLKQPSLP